MADTLNYKAPWGHSLKMMTFSLMTLLLSILALHIFLGNNSNESPHPALQVLFLAPVVLILLIMPLFMIRGYVLTDSELVIRRLIWKNTIKLRHFISADCAPFILAGSFRIGNGGFFSISGYFQNKRVGSCEAWVTDTARTVLIELHSRKIVISPENPEQFIDDINQRMTILRNGGDTNA